MMMRAAHELDRNAIIDYKDRTCVVLYAEDLISENAVNLIIRRLLSPVIIEAHIPCNEMIVYLGQAK